MCFVNCWFSSSILSRHIPRVWMPICFPLPCVLSFELSNITFPTLIHMPWMVFRFVQLFSCNVSIVIFKASLSFHGSQIVTLAIGAKEAVVNIYGHSNSSFFFCYKEFWHHCHELPFPFLMYLSRYILPWNTHIMNSKEPRSTYYTSTQKSCHGQLPSQASEAPARSRVHFSFGWLDARAWDQWTTLLSRSYYLCSSHVSGTKHALGGRMLYT